MNLVEPFVDFFLHLDKHLDVMIDQYGGWSYAILFLVIFCETGLVITPILPGDSLIFAAGIFAGRGDLDAWLLLLLLSIAAILGDAVNYSVGYFMGPKVFRNENSRIFKKEYLERTHQFYEKYGTKTIVLARFAPIVRTFAPFVAGVGKMSYPRFALYNVIGGIAWVAIFLFAGVKLGEVKLVRDNLTVIALLIVFVSVLPMVVEYFRNRRHAASPPSG